MIWQIVIVVLALVAIAVLLFSQQSTLLPIEPEVKPSTGGIYTEALVGSFNRLNPILDYASPADIGTLLFNEYLLPFEITSVLLLVAMIGAIFLTKKEKQ